MRDHSEPGKPQGAGGQDGNPDGERGRGIKPGEQSKVGGEKVDTKDEAQGNTSQRQSGHQGGEPQKTDR
jgi:hypothetical protein